MFAVKHFPDLVKNLHSNIVLAHRREHESTRMSFVHRQTKHDAWNSIIYAQCPEFEQLIQVALQVKTDTIHTVSPETWCNQDIKHALDKELISPFHRQVGFEEVYYHPLCALLHMTYFQPNLTKRRYAFSFWITFMDRLGWNLPSTQLMICYFHQSLVRLFDKNHYSVDAVPDFRWTSWYIQMLS